MAIVTTQTDIEVHIMQTGGQYGCRIEGKPETFAIRNTVLDVIEYAENCGWIIKSVLGENYKTGIILLGG